MPAVNSGTPSIVVKMKSGLVTTPISKSEAEKKQIKESNLKRFRGGGGGGAKTAGEIVKEARVEAKTTGQNELELIRQKSEVAVAEEQKRKQQETQQKAIISQQLQQQETQQKAIISQQLQQQQQIEAQPPTEIKGTYTAVPQREYSLKHPIQSFQNLSEAVVAKSDVFILKSERTEKSIKGDITRVGYKVGAIGAAGAGVVLGTFAHPVQTAKGMIETIKHPKESIKEFVSQPPEVIVGQVGGMFALGKIAGAIVRKSPIKLEYESISVPTAKGEVTVARAAGVKVGTEGYPIVYQKGISGGVGTPKIETVPEISGEFQPKTAIGGKVFQKNVESFITKPTRISEEKIITAAEYQEYSVKGLEAAKQLAKQKSLFTEQQVLTEGTTTLNPQAVKSVLEMAKKEKGIVYGSKATQPQLKSGLRREVGDIDIYFKTASEQKLTKIAQETLWEVKKSEPTASISEKEPFHISTIREGVEVKAVEFKGEGIGDSEAIAPRKAFGFDLKITKDTEKVAGYKVASITGESPRKLAATVAVRQKAGEVEALGVAHKGRFKDIPDYFRIIETQTESAKLIGKPYLAGEEFLKLKERFGIVISKEEPVLISTPANKQKSSIIPSPILISPKTSPVTTSPSPSLIPSPKPSPVPSPKLSPSPSPIISPKPSPIPSPSPIIFPSILPSLKPSPRPSPKRSPTPSPRPSPSPSPIVSPTSPSPIISPSPSPSLSPYPSPSPSPSPAPSPSPIIFPSPFSRRSKKSQKYEVLVRRQKQFRTIAVTESLESAFAAGRTRVLHTAAASFKVKPIGSTESTSVAGKRLVSPKMFYESKKEPGTFIQKRSFRISTPGEKGEITYKGIFASRTKNKLFGVF